MQRLVRGHNGVCLGPIYTTNHQNPASAALGIATPRKAVFTRGASQEAWRLKLRIDAVLQVARSARSRSEWGRRPHPGGVQKDGRENKRMTGFAAATAIPGADCRVHPAKLRCSIPPQPSHATLVVCEYSSSFAAAARMRRAVTLATLAFVAGGAPK